MKNSIFPDDLKLAEVMQKKADSFDKTDNQPVTLLFHLSKIFVRIICNRIDEYIEPCLSTLQTGFHKNHDTFFFHRTFFIENARNIFRKL